MAIGNLEVTLLTYTESKNRLTLDITNLQSQKALAVAAQADANSIKAKDEEEVRRFFKALYEDDPEYKGKYSDYTQIPDFEEEMDKIAAKYNDELAELTAWETALDNQITTKDAEIKEIEAYEQSFKSMLQNNIQEDFKLGLG